MRKLFVLCLLMLSMGIFAQPKGINYRNALELSALKIGYEGLFVSKQNEYVFNFKHNTEGYKHSLEKIKEICSANDLIFNSPLVDDSFKDVNLKAYDTVYIICYLGEDKIFKAWDVDGWRIAWGVNKYLISIIITENK